MDNKAFFVESPPRINLYLAVVPDDILSRIAADDSISARKRAISHIAGRMAASAAGYPGSVAHRADGSPHLCVAPGICVSISHCGNVIAAGASGAAHGVDIERISTVRDSVLRRAYRSGEQRYILSAADETARAERFFTVWTRKEALIKAAGLTLGAGMQVDTCPSGEPCDVLNLGGNEWHFASQSVRGHVLSVCSAQYADISLTELSSAEICRLLQNDE